MSRRTWKSPNHLLTPSISMIFWPPGGASALTTVLVAASVISFLHGGASRAPRRGARSPDPHPERTLELAGGDAQPVGEEEVHDGDEQEHLELDAARYLQRLRLHGHDVGDPEEVGEADDEDQRGVLEQADGLA